MPQRTQTVPNDSALTRLTKILLSDEGGLTRQALLHILGGQSHDLAIATANFSQSLPSATNTELGLNVENIDSAGAFVGSTTTNRFTVPKTGWYRCSINIALPTLTSPDAVLELYNLTTAAALRSWFWETDGFGRSSMSKSIAANLTSGHVVIWRVANFTGASRSLPTGTLAPWVEYHFLHD